MKRCLILGSVALLAVCGCDNSAPPVGKAQQTTAAEHDHPHEGPHHGTLVELGKEEYHAEVTHTADSVTVYILDAHAKAAVPIDATEVVINVVHAGQPEQFKLAANPESGESDGKSSRFTLSDAELASHIDDAAAAPKLSLTISGKPYRGEIKHDHDHDHNHDHDHAH